MSETLRVAITGMGGYARSHHRAVRQIENEGGCRLVATCDPNVGTFGEFAGEMDFAGRGVSLYESLDAMLSAHAGGLDVVTLPTPLPLHRAMHRACVEAGAACYLEKPPTLYTPELEAMIDADCAARVPTQVGFNFIVEPVRRELKRRILSGEFGSVREVGFWARWPRARTYFRRTGWAGRLFLDTRPVLDSCAGNALSHHVHNTLFWAGGGEVLSWAEPVRVRAELYRVHAIESFDTVFSEAELAGGIRCRMGLSHAGGGHGEPWEWIVCDDARIEYCSGDRAIIRRNDGREEVLDTTGMDVKRDDIRYYLDVAAGREPRPMTRLEDARPFVHWYNLLFVSSGAIFTVPEKPRTNDGADPNEAPEIEDLDTAFERFVESGELPSEQGVRWASPADCEATMSDLPRLDETLSRMAADAPAQGGSTP